ncbi:permease [Streptomyces sp. NBC_00390]|uniref:permease n=1 Tax=Streptomyces sp. NBC_00390 TaxID=2975736 RepID=UPI002E1E1478
MDAALDAVRHALSLTGSMAWEITWALILGFTLSAVVQAVVRKSTVVSLLGVPAAWACSAPWAAPPAPECPVLLNLCER